MTSTHSSNPPNFPEETHFDGTNYATFKNRVVIAARARGARGYLDGTITKPEPAVDKKSEQRPTEWSSKQPSLEEWEERDAWALGLIIYNTKNPVGLGIKMDGSAAEAWTTLTENYGVFSEIAAINAEKRLRATEFSDGMDFLKHVEDLREKWRSATEKGAKIDDSTFRTILIASLPESWNAVVAGIYAKTESKDVIAALTVHWDRLVLQKQKAGISATALQTQTKPRLVCVNPNCRRNGHTIDNCYWRGGGKEGQFPPNFRNKNKMSRTPSSETQTPATPAPPAANIAESTAQPTMPTPQQNTQPHVTYALSAMSLPTGALTSKIDVPTYADSGATDHFFVDRGMFTNYEELTSPVEGHAAPKGARFRVIGRGTVRKICKTTNGVAELVFKNALHAPDLTSNLISINKFDQAGFNVTFGGGVVRFQDPSGREVMCGKGTSGMYLLSTFSGTGAPSAMIAKSQLKPTSLEVWHRRFGHASVTAIRNALSKDLVDGLVIKGALNVPGICEDCVFGKHTARPYDAEVEPEGAPNDCVHVDLWGPSSVSSLGGATYMMVAVDGGSSFISVFFLTRKDATTTLTAFTAYHMESERQTGRKLKEVRVDAGREWVNESWSAYLQTHGIVLRVTTPYAHAQNGVAERANRTILEGVRCVLAESALSRELWAEAASAQVYTRNLLPSSRHPNTIPRETWTGRRQRVDHLRPWGCLAWAKVPDELVKSKLDPRSVRTRLVGYANSGYRLYDPRSRSIVTSRDVIFEEGTGHRPLTILDETMDCVTRTTGTNHSGSPTAPGLLQPRQPIAPRVRPGPLHHDDATIREPETNSDRSLALPELANQTPPPTTVQPLRRSTRQTRPTPALVAAQETLQREQAAREGGEDWAADGDPPTALLAEGPYGYLSSLDIDGQDKDVKVPKTYTEAMKRPDLWQPAMDEELKIMDERGVFELIDEAKVPKDKNIVGCRWVYANKYNAEGEVVRRKARLVAKGFSQVAGEDFDETYAAVVRLESLRMSAAVAAREGFEVWQIDFVSAYLNSIPEHEVYMRLPPGFPGGEGKLALLRKTLYGLMQGGFDWYWTLDGTYADLGYRRSRADPCVRSRTVGGETTITNTFNDDIFGLSSTKEGAQKAKAELSNAYEVKDLGEPTFILGMAIHRDPLTKSISLSQKAYLTRVLDRFGMTNCNPRYTPLPSGTVLTTDMSPKDDAERAFMQDKPYRQLLGALMWAQAATRPDLSFAIGLLARFQSNPGPAHWKSLLHVLAYVKHTLDYRITYSRSLGESIKPTGYVDADFGGDLDTRRSTSGYIYMMSGGPVSWSSKRQQTVALSTTEAEYMAMTRGSQQALWMHNFLSEIGLEQPLPATLHVDNNSSIALAESTKGHSRAKHIDIRHHYIRERVQEGDIEVRHIPSAENLADIFTKPLPRAAHDYLVNRMGLKSQESRTSQGEC